MKSYSDADLREYEEQELPYEGRRKPSSSPPRAPSPNMLKPMSYVDEKGNEDDKTGEEDTSPPSTGDKPVEKLKSTYWENFRKRRKGV